MSARAAVTTTPYGEVDAAALEGLQARYDTTRGRCHVRALVSYDDVMKKTKSLYHGHRFPASVISHAVRWYFRFQLSLRDIEELLFERGVVVSRIDPAVDGQVRRQFCASGPDC
ncbi:hypothetical protein OKW30_008145 [Paraburkholderia sp. Clong3]